jgi:uncharacterized SAM-binding protein YcdF (DUF218 family)
MFVFKKLITPFLLPPGLFVILLSAWGIWALRRRQRLSGGISLSLAAMVWILSAAPTSGWLMGGLEKGWPIPDDPRGDVIIMLGGGGYDRAPDLSGRGAPNASSMERLVTAARLYRRLGVPILLSGGKVEPTDVPIARISKRFLIDLGVPPESILLEDQSRDTYENALFSKKLCTRHGLVHPLMVTSGYHIRRAVFCFEQVGMRVTPVPCGLTTWPGQAYTLRELLPAAESMQATSAALHEWLGLLYYHLRY